MKFWLLGLLLRWFIRWLISKSKPWESLTPAERGKATEIVALIEECQSWAATNGLRQ